MDDPESKSLQAKSKSIVESKSLQIKSKSIVESIEQPKLDDIVKDAERPRSPQSLPREPSSSVILGKKSKKAKSEKMPVPEYKYGWGKFTPNFLQRFHTPECLLTCLCLLLTIQGTVVNGVLPASVSHLEKKFHFSSREIGAISSMFDSGVLIMLLPISLFGTRVHQGRCIAIGALVLGAGSIVCTLAHFLSPAYAYGFPVPPAMCSSNSSDSDCDFKDDYKFEWKYLLFVGQFLHGVGASPLMTVAISYLDENVSKRMWPVYQGVYSMPIIIGPCLGYGIAAITSQTYGDINSADMDKLPMTPTDQRWYGAWWIGVLASGILSCLIAVPIFGFGRELPGTAEFRKQDAADEAFQHGGALSLSASLTGWDEFKHQLRTVCRNPTYVGCAAEQCATMFIVTGFSVFSTKYLEKQFSMTTASASLFAGATAVPPALLANVIGTAFQRRLDLMCNGNLILAILTTAVATSLWPVFYIQCATRHFAGITSFLTSEGKPKVASTNLTEVCNDGCHCNLERFEPACLVNESVSFFSQCHAGCVYKDEFKNTTKCECAGDGIVVNDFCESQCSAATYLPFLFGLAFLVLFMCMKRNPVQQVLLRCVPKKMRTFGLALSSIPLRLFGSIPAAPIFGEILGNACVVYQMKCNKREVCVLYDNNRLASYMQVTGLLCTGTSYVLLVIAWCFYVPTPGGEEAPPNSDSDDSSIFLEALRVSWQEPVVVP